MITSPDSEEPPLTDEEIEVILAAENAELLESHESVPQHRVVESHGNLVSWLKWLFWFALFSELMMGVLQKW